MGVASLADPLWAVGGAARVFGKILHFVFLLWFSRVQTEGLAEKASINQRAVVQEIGFCPSLNICSLEFPSLSFCSHVLVVKQNRSV